MNRRIDKAGIEKENEVLCDIFLHDLVDAGLAEKTIREHVSNASLFLEVILDHDECRMVEGEDALYSFFSYYIRKCLWSTPSSVRRLGASLRKFYKSMIAHGKISREDGESFMWELKMSLDEFVEDCEAFNSLGW